jgi:hypothetical protein
MDSLIRDHIHSRLIYRFVDANGYADAMAVENVVKAGGLGQPRLNPTRR